MTGFAKVTQGESFGELCFLSNGARSATATALEDTECIAIDGAGLTPTAGCPIAVYDLALRGVVAATSHALHAAPLSQTGFQDQGGLAALERQ